MYVRSGRCPPSWDANETLTEELAVFHSTHMKGDYAFCPKSGAPLSEEIHYDELGHAHRHVLGDDTHVEQQQDGELTNGSLRSSKTALFNYFRRCHDDRREPNSKLYSRAALALSRLKRTASGTEEWDMYVWFALAERLEVHGFDACWMNAHIEPRCPQCAGRLKYERLVGDELVARCGTNCTTDSRDRLAEIRETVVDLYGRAFTVESSDALSEDDLVLL